ncbi:cytochrome b [Bartonella sp. DGB2]|uniref:cytochrome b n=1 Tax=Bartonella sp. DGB2 TaxID=3388426 RepID=UPI00398FBD73
MNRPKRYRPQGAFARWLDARLPFWRFFYIFFIEFQIPRNLNYLYSFGGILCLLFLSQLLTGISIAMHYIPDIEQVFMARDHFMRHIAFGWLLVPWHATGASFFFLAMYIHIARSLYYGSYKAPREVVWVVGVILYFIMMAIAFSGYVLVWGQMSVSAMTVISNLFKTLPFVGNWLYETLLGGYTLGQPTLNRLMIFHYFLPMLLLFFLILHIWALHHVGQSNPSGIPAKKGKDTIPFHPYGVVKDFFAAALFMLIFSWFLFFMPDYMGQPANFIAGDPLQTAPHIVPEWYFLPFYAILRAIDFNIGSLLSTTTGGAVLIASLLIWLFLPWLDRSRLYCARHRPIYRLFFWLFIADLILLGWLGAQPVENWPIGLAQGCVFYYFFFFLVILPFLPYFEKNVHPLHASIADQDQYHKTREKRGSLF